MSDLRTTLNAVERGRGYLNGNLILLSIFVFIFVYVSQREAVADDWAFQLSADAKNIYALKKTQISCEDIEKLLDANDLNGIYTAIRDAGLFGIKACDRYIMKNRSKLDKFDGVKEAIAFYYYKNGKSSELNSLLASFDKNASAIGDHWTVDLFGFLNEWQQTGRRLVRHAGYTDNVGAELLCSAIMWRRYLYGEKTFEVCCQ